MSHVRSTNTLPELLVRKIVFSLGYRYRLHSRNLPGKPDLVFFKRRKVIFAHGCFWHGHKGCSKARLPKSRIEFWKQKMTRNRKRDRMIKRKLQEMGWACAIIWQCEMKDINRLTKTLKRFLGPV
jgi:DNA mismatch endonuclease (patch repair protein)